MPKNRDTSADVSGVSAVNEKLHQARAREVLAGNLIGTAVAISSVFATRQLAPQTVLAAERALAKQLHSSGAAARKSLNTALMLTSGLCSGIASQTLFARRRRDGYDLAHDIPVSRDITRLLTGWSFGSIGASAAYFLAENASPQLLRLGERVLDAALGGFEYAPENKLSEALMANAAMTIGAIPANVVGQRLYDAALAHPAYAVQQH